MRYKKRTIRWRLEAVVECRKPTNNNLAHVLYVRGRERRGERRHPIARPERPTQKLPSISIYRECYGQNQLVIFRRGQNLKKNNLFFSMYEVSLFEQKRNDGRRVSLKAGLDRSRLQIRRTRDLHRHSRARPILPFPFLSLAPIFR